MEGKDPILEYIQERKRDIAEMETLYSQLRNKNLELYELKSNGRNYLIALPEPSRNVDEEGRTIILDSDIPLLEKMYGEKAKEHLEKGWFRVKRIDRIGLNFKLDSSKLLMVLEEGLANNCGHQRGPRVETSSRGF